MTVTDEQLCKKYRSMIKGYAEGNIEDGLGRKAKFKYSDVSRYNVHSYTTRRTQGGTVNRDIRVHSFSIALKNGENIMFEKHDYENLY